MTSFWTLRKKLFRVGLLRTSRFLTRPQNLAVVITSVTEAPEGTYTFVIPAQSAAGRFDAVKCQDHWPKARVRIGRRNYLAMMKVGNTSFREEAIKKMTFKDFKKTYEGILKGQDLREVYQEVTGSKSEEDGPSKGGNVSDLG